MLLLGTMANEMPGFLPVYCQGLNSAGESSKEGLAMAWGHVPHEDIVEMMVTVAVIVEVTVAVGAEASAVTVCVVMVVAIEPEVTLVTAAVFGRAAEATFS